MKLGVLYVDSTQKGNSVMKETSTRTLHPNAQLVLDYFEAMRQLDKNALAAKFTDDARWWVPISAEQRGLVARPVEGGATVVEMLATIMPRLYGPVATWTIQHVVADDETGAAEVELDTTVASSGKPYRNTYAFIYRFVDGRIAEVWEYTDTDYAYGIWGEFDKSAVGH
jgi:ketosteroid isomerase-like protein